jgi:SAM-dependent methyltransferase
MPEFDYQWKNLPSANTEYAPARLFDFLKFTKLPMEFFNGKHCLDAGCGNGRWTYAMQQFGAEVDSFDISPAAVEQCREVNPRAEVRSITNLVVSQYYDFVLCWGVLHHLADPVAGFCGVASQVAPGGILHVMVYHKKTQEQYTGGRSRWPAWSNEERLKYCENMVARHGGDVHGWWDAFNPTYNWGFTPKEVKPWFVAYGFNDIKLTQKYNINMRGVYRG